MPKGARMVDARAPCFPSACSDRLLPRQSRLGMTVARLHEPALVSEDDGLDAVAKSELGEDVGDVRLRRMLAYDEVRRYLVIREPAGEQLENLALALR